MKYKFNSKLIGVCAVPLVLAAVQAVAQTEDLEQAAAAIEEIIVTGVTENTRKFDATFSINTLDEKDMQMLAPNGTADLLGNIPGFFPEGGTAGESHNNVLVRGLPQAGGYRYVPNLIDGLPMYEEPEAPFMNNDVFIKNDLMTTRVEVVKGGPGGVLYSNALGAAVNYVTRTGTQQFEGGYKLELGDWGYVRNDMFLSGPINDNLTFAVGGFYRVADGQRDPGYTGDNGGQFRGNIKYISDDQSTELVLQAHLIRDKTNYYQNIPFTVPNNRAPGTDGDPFEISPNQVKNMGIDFGDGTPLSLAVSQYQLYNPDGSRALLDISEGIKPEFDIFTVRFKKELSDDWRIETGIRSSSGTNGFNAMFNDPPFETQELLQQQYARIQGFSGALGQGYADAVGVKAYYTDSVTGTDLSTATEAPAVLANNIPVNALVDASNFTADFRVGKLFSVAGTNHDFTFGLYTSAFSYDVTSVFAQALADISESARLVDLFAINANEQQVGASITDNGVLQPAIFGLGANSDMRTHAVYFLDSISLLDEKLSIDVGARWQELNVNRVITNSSNPGNESNDFTPANVEVGSTGDTLADNFVNVPDGSPQFASEKYDAVGWSLGANYLLTDDVSIYLTYADSFRLPGFEDYIFGGPATNASTGEIARGDLIEDIAQIEGGVRLMGDTFDLTASGFFIDFQAKENLGATLDDLSATGFNGVACNSVPAPANCPKVRDSFRQTLENYGVELEGSWRPEALSGFEIQGSIVWQDPTFSQDHSIRSGVEEFDTDGDGVNDSRDYVVSTTEERRPRRQSEWLVNLRPSYDFGEMGLPLTVYAQALYYSERFSSDSNVDVTVYPEYTQINMGAIYNVSDNLDLQLHINNVNDADSFTEGSSISSGLAFSDDTYTGVARPLMGRHIKASLYYHF